MLGNNLPFWFQQFRYADGRPLAGGKLYTYVSESSIPKKVYYDVEMTIPATNPVELDSAGYLPEIFLEAGLYTFELRDKNGILIARRDNINSIDFDSIFQPFGYFLPLSGGTLSGTLSGTNITISGGVSATKFSMANAEFVPGTRQHSIKLVGNDGNYSDYTATIGFGVEDKAVIGTLDGKSLNLSASFIELEGANTYIKKGNFVVGEISETNNVTLQDWGFLDQRGDARFDGTLSAKEGVIIPGKTNSDILVADGSTINLSGISASPYFTAGVIDGTLAEIVDNGGGSFTVQSCNVSLFPSTNYVGNLKQYYVAGGTFTATDLAEEYVCVNYNSGSPYMYLETNKANINEANIICLYIIWRQGNVIHSIQTDSKGIGLSNKTSFAITNTTPYRKSIDGGLVVSETMSPHERTILVTSAIVYAGVIPIDVKSFKSNTDTLTMVFKNSGNWVFNNGPYYNNSEYFDGTSIQFMNPNKYSPRWIYRSIGDTKQVFYMLGNEYSTIAAAKEELPPSDLPKVVKNHCMLVARIIIQNGASSGIVNNISDINLSYASVSNHNDLDGLQGGSIGNYYHISATTFGYLSAVSADIQEQINSKADISAVPTITDIGNYLPLSGGAMTGHLSARNIIPEASFVYSLGTSSSRWADFYCRVLTADSLTTTIDTVTSRMKLILGDGDNFGTNGQLQFRERSTFYAPNAVSGDFYSDGNNLHFYDKSKTKRTLAYTSDLASSISGYLPLSGGTVLSGVNFNQNIYVSQNISANSFKKHGGLSTQFLKADGSIDSNSYALKSSLGNYLPISGGTLTGQLKVSTISASGNISASSFIKNGGTSTQFLKADGSIDSNSYALNSSLGNYLPISGGTMTGDISFTNLTTGIGKGLYGTNGDNDHWRIVGGSNGLNQCYLEIATNDDKSEPIYIKQYQGTFSSPVSTRTLTLLDSNGNTLIPQTLSSTNYYNAGSYYVSNYAAGGSPALITNQGLATFYTLNLDYYSTGERSLKFADCVYLGPTYATDFNNGSTQNNALVVKGAGNYDYAGIYFGTAGINSRYIGTKGDNTLYINGPSIKTIGSLTQTGTSTFVGNTNIGRVAWINEYTNTVYDKFNVSGTTTISDLISNGSSTFNGVITTHGVSYFNNNLIQNEGSVYLGSINNDYALRVKHASYFTGTTTFSTNSVTFNSTSEFNSSANFSALTKFNVGSVIEPVFVNSTSYTATDKSPGFLAFSNLSTTATKIILSDSIRDGKCILIFNWSSDTVNGRTLESSVAGGIQTSPSTTVTSTSIPNGYLYICIKFAAGAYAGGWRVRAL